MKKRVLSGLLAAVLSVSMFSVTAFADEYDISAATETTGDSEELQIVLDENTVAPDTASVTETVAEPVLLAAAATGGTEATITIPPQVQEIIDKIRTFAENLANSGYADMAKEMLGQLEELLNKSFENLNLPDLSELIKILEKLPTELSPYAKTAVEYLTKIVKDVINKVQNLDKEEIDKIVNKVKDAIETVKEAAKEASEHPQAVVLNKVLASVNVGQKVQLGAVVLPLSAKNKAVTWKSSDTSIATVSSTGLVTAKNIGSANITVTTKDGKKKATCKVMVYKSVSDLTISISPKSAAYTGSEITPKVTVKSGSTKLRVNQDYIVKYRNNIEVGTATVIIIGRGFYVGWGQRNFKITKAPNTLTVSKTSYAYKQSSLTSAKTFTIGTKNAIGTVTYTCDSKAKNAGIKVTSAGKVTIPKKCAKGTYTIAVKAAGDSTHSAKTVKVTITIK